MNLQMEVLAAMDLIKQMEVEEGARDDKVRSISKIFSRRSLYRLLTQILVERHQCFLWEILVSDLINHPTNHLWLLVWFFSGDYAWGREGLDTIVTQLLNQMDNAGLYIKSCYFKKKISWGYEAFA